MLNEEIKSSRGKLLSHVLVILWLLLIRVKGNTSQEKIITGGAGFENCERNCWHVCGVYVGVHKRMLCREVRVRRVSICYHKSCSREEGLVREEVNMGSV